MLSKLEGMSSDKTLFDTMRLAYEHFKFPGKFNNHRYLHDSTGIIMCYSSGNHDDVIEVEDDMIVFWVHKRTVQKAFIRSLKHNTPLHFFQKNLDANNVEYLGKWVPKRLEFNYVLLKKYTLDT